MDPRKGDHLNKTGPPVTHGSVWGGGGQITDLGWGFVYFMDSRKGDLLKGQ